MTKILITGLSGFVGSHLCEYILKETDWQIVGLDNLNYSGNINRLTDIDIWEQEKHRVKYLFHDLQAPISEMTTKMIGENIDYIVHAGAETTVQRSLQDPLLFIKSNAIGTAHLLEYVRNYQKNVKRLIYVSSDETLGMTPPDISFSEEQRLNPSSPYSAGKAMGELIVNAWVKSFNLPILTLRSCNIYGTKQYPEDFIPLITKTLLEKKKITLHGDPKRPSIRSWVNVEDVCLSLILLLEKGKDGEIYHLKGQQRGIDWVANKICQVVNGRSLNIDDFDWKEKPYLGHDFNYRMSSKNLEELGFEPRFNIEKGLIETIEWMVKKENQKWLNI